MLVLLSRLDLVETDFFRELELDFKIRIGTRKLESSSPTEAMT